MKVLRLLVIFSVTLLGITKTVNAQVNRKLHYSEDGRTIQITIENNTKNAQLWDRISQFNKEDQEMVIYLLTSEGIKQLGHLNTNPKDLIADSNH